MKVAFKLCLAVLDKYCTGSLETYLRKPSSYCIIRNHTARVLPYKDVTENLVFVVFTGYFSWDSSLSFFQTFCQPIQVPVLLCSPFLCVLGDHHLTSTPVALFLELSPLIDGTVTLIQGTYILSVCNFNLYIMYPSPHDWKFSCVHRIFLFVRYIIKFLVSLFRVANQVWKAQLEFYPNSWRVWSSISVYLYKLYKIHHGVCSMSLRILGQLIAVGGAEVRSIGRVRMGWKNLRVLLSMVTTGSLPLYQKGKIYVMCVRSFMYSSGNCEGGELERKNVHQLQRAELRMVICMCTKTLKDKNTCTAQNYKRMAGHWMHQ